MGGYALGQQVTRAATLALLLALPAQAAVVAEIVVDDERLELHDEAGPCQRGALWAMLYKGRERLSGCWTLRPDGRVTIAWFDGGCWAVPASAFKEPRPL